VIVQHASCPSRRVLLGANDKTLIRKNLGSVSEILRAVARQRGLEFLVLVRDEAAQVRERLPMSLCRLEGDRSRRCNRCNAARPPACDRDKSRCALQRGELGGDAAERRCHVSRPPIDEPRDVRSIDSNSSSASMKVDMKRLTRPIAVVASLR
jgi:hypothetical protein